MRQCAAFAAAALLSSVAVPGNASTITETYDFSATFGTGAPVSTWSGQFTITFDPTVTGTGTFDSFSSNLVGYGTFGYSQEPGPGSMAIGDQCNLIGCFTTTGDQFSMVRLPRE